MRGDFFLGRGEFFGEGGGWWFLWGVERRVSLGRCVSVGGGEKGFFGRCVSFGRRRGGGVSFYVGFFCGFLVFFVCVCVFFVCSFFPFFSLIFFCWVYFYFLILSVNFLCFDNFALIFVFWAFFFFAFFLFFSAFVFLDVLDFLCVLDFWGIFKDVRFYPILNFGHF